MTVSEEVTLAIKVVDHVSATAKQMQASAEDAKVSVDSLEHSMDALNTTAGSVSMGVSDAVRTSSEGSGKVTSSVEAMEDAVSDAVSDVRRALDEIPPKADAVEDAVSDAMASARAEVRKTIDAMDGSSMDTVSANSRKVRDQVKADAVEINQAVMAVQTKQALELSQMMAVKESVSAITGGMIALGVVSDDTAKALMQVNAGFQLVAGAATGIKALSTMMAGLNAQTAINASLNTFLSVVRNHALGLAAVGAGLGAMAGIAGMYLYTNNQNNNVNIEIQDTEPSKDTANQIYDILYGGPV